MADPGTFTIRIAAEGDAPAVAELYQEREGVSADDAHLWVEKALAKRRLFYFANARNQATIDLHAEFGFVEIRRVDMLAGVSFDGGEGILFEARGHVPLHGAVR